MNYYFQAWRKAFDFKSRARRKEYFTFIMINGFISNLLIRLGTDTVLVTIGFLFILIYLIPAWAVGIRRMHDLNRSGWFFFIPIAGAIMAFYDGTSGHNSFGPDPKLRGAESDPESMALRSPVSRPPEPWQCSNCNTRNAAEVIECATCSRGRN